MAEATPQVQWQSVSVQVDGGQLAAQATGGPHDPAVLLIGGATWSRDWWTDGFCAALAGHGLRVIRYDMRDTGESTLSPPGQPEYTGENLILDAVGVREATVVGLSMGGGIAQEIAAYHRDRVAALVLISTSPVTSTGVELPGPTPEIRALFAAQPADPDWEDRESVIEWVVNGERPYAGPNHFDEEAVRAVAGRAVNRTPSMASAATNHFLIASSGPPVRVEALRGIPTLVVHGSADPLFPLAHGQALATALGAPIMILDGVGHQIPPATFWPELFRGIARLAREAHTSGKGTP